MPSGKWPLNNEISTFLPGSDQATRQQWMNTPTTADLLKREPIPLASDTDGYLLTYDVKLGSGHLARFLEVETAVGYLQALDTLASLTGLPPRATTEKIEVMSSADQPSRAEPATDPRAVFLVHGRNEAATTAMTEFLQGLDLSVISWTQANNAARRKVGRQPSTLETVEAGLYAAATVVVLFTPDDLVILDPRVAPGETDLAGQARANVILEAGMIIGMAHGKAVFVQLGGQRPISDIVGLNFVNMGDKPGQRDDLADRLGPEGVGLPVKKDLRRLLSAGRFDDALSYLSEPRPFDLGSDASEPGAVVSEDEHREALGREIESIIRCADAQGWVVVNNSRKVLRLRGPRGQVRELPRPANASETRKDMRRFAGELRAAGLRVNQRVRRPLGGKGSNVR